MNVQNDVSPGSDDWVDLGRIEVQLQPSDAAEPKPEPDKPAAEEPAAPDHPTDTPISGGRLPAAFIDACKRLGPVDVNGLLTIAIEDMKAAANFAPFLPLIFQVLPGLPFSLHESLPFGPLYDRDVPEQFLLKAGSGCGKSTNAAFKTILMAATIPNLKAMFVTPLQVQCQRFVHNYVRAAIRNSPVLGAIVSRKCRDNALLKELANGSTLLFSHASRDCERARHTPCDVLCIDGVENVNIDFLALLAENLSASRFGNRIYAGAGKTFDDALHCFWGESSQGEWIVKCRSCGKENMPLADEDLFNMLGPKGLVCAGCGYPLDSMADGRYVHRFPDRVAEFPGLHISQPILPVHNRNSRRWDALLKKARTWPKSQFCSIVLGEERDCGTRLVPKELIRKASVLPFPNELGQARAYAREAKHVRRTLGIDWRGKGQMKDAATAMTVVGLRDDGKTDILLALKMDPSATEEQELAMAAHLYQEFGCSNLGHGLHEMGEYRQMSLAQLGLGHAMGWSLETTSGKFFAKEHRNPAGVDYTRLNRPAGIQLLAHELSNLRMFLPQWREDLVQNPFADFSSWYENVVEHANGRRTVQVLRSARQPDNVGMAALYGTCANWRVANCWPSYMRELKPEGIILATDEEVAAVVGTAV